jgi:hypothetical protein
MLLATGLLLANIEETTATDDGKVHASGAESSVPIKDMASLTKHLDLANRRKRKSLLPNSPNTASSITKSVCKVKEVNNCDLPHHHRIQDDSGRV